ncbi:MAG: response regulator transcription factor [Gemmatimonadales bacterium]|nr:response regulator transcription factor [Gemmatimonadales bacterium]
MSATILVVEDDGKTADTVSLYLRHAGFKVAVAPNGLEGLRRATAEPFDLVILDRMLPGLSGEEICRRLKSAADVPVIILTAMVEEEDRLDGFKAGVDDYVTKPFSPRELVARVRAVLRRAGGSKERGGDTVRVGALVLDQDAREAWLGDRALELSPTEFRMLTVLARAPGKVFPREELAERILREGSEADIRTVDAHVKNLRRKLDRGGSDSCIMTVFGVGYRLSAEACRRA